MVIAPVMDSPISIHAPRAGSDIAARHIVPRDDVFQSTLPVRGATQSSNTGWRNRPISIHAPRAGSDTRAKTLQSCCRYFNPRSPCGERRFAVLTHHRKDIFQSTLPVRGATSLGKVFPCVDVFQSTLPVRGATQRAATEHNDEYISIHAPRAGSDQRAQRALCAFFPISIHAPRAGSDAHDA